MAGASKNRTPRNPRGPKKGPGKRPKSGTVARGRNVTALQTYERTRPKTIRRKVVSVPEPVPVAVGVGETVTIELSCPIPEAYAPAIVPSPGSRVAIKDMAVGDEFLHVVNIGNQPAAVLIVFAKQQVLSAMRVGAHAIGTFIRNRRGQS